MGRRRSSPPPRPPSTLPASAGASSTSWRRPRRTPRTPELRHHRTPPSSARRPAVATRRLTPASSCCSTSPTPPGRATSTPTATWPARASCPATPSPACRWPRSSPAPRQAATPAGAARPVPGDQRVRSRCADLPRGLHATRCPRIAPAARRGGRHSVGRGHPHGGPGLRGLRLSPPPAGRASTCASCCGARLADAWTRPAPAADR